MGECGKMGLFHPRGRGPHHGAEPVVLPTPRGCSRPHLPPHPCRVARQATPHAPAAPRIQQAPTHTLQRTQALSRADPQTAVRGLCAGGRCPPHSAGLTTSLPPLHPRTSAYRQHPISLLPRSGLRLPWVARPWQHPRQWSSQRSRDGRRCTARIALTERSSRSRSILCTSRTPPPRPPSKSTAGCPPQSPPWKR
jgi:hypothetical protein